MSIMVVLVCNRCGAEGGRGPARMSGGAQRLRLDAEKKGWKHVGGKTIQADYCADCAPYRRS